MNGHAAAKRILVLPSWYPSAVQRAVGDFTQRHIQAISTIASQYVIHVVKDEEGTMTKKNTTVKQVYDTYTEELIYYHPVKTGLRLLDRFISDRTYNRLYKKAITKYISDQGLPELTHVHVALKAGTMAVWLKKKYGVPYVVTEHWSGYLDAAEETFTDLHPLVQERGKQVFEQASMVTTVSSVLAKALKKLFTLQASVVVPNVVDREVFFAKQHERTETVRFIHASSMSWPKNIEAILKAVELLKEKDPRFVLRLFGPLSIECKTLIRTCGISDHIIHEGEVSQQVLAAAMRASDAFIMYSRYETFGNVIIESNACGLPVIASDIPVFRETIIENINGIFAGKDDPAMLAEKMLQMMQGKIIFNKQVVIDSAAKYHYEVVGQQFSQLYESIKN
ncbi:glycosyltransferase [Ferruginibacter sp. HRS2-29]|uniref:glycosyltransferase n=1 Tax=Ferruginibacter sp. HRS2-29 TaxID=2487334 RepID=UPI0020CBF049|nr:glycosyltransferase [Ferruginibacter sp. HRS2-29]MCP9751438.1 glycosyltransferase [Ferruginibacter sp. HRS2-29]